MFKIFNNQLVEAPIGHPGITLTTNNAVLVRILPVSTWAPDLFDFFISKRRKCIYFHTYLQPDHFRKTWRHNILESTWVHGHRSQ